MKKMNFRLAFFASALTMMLVTSCKKDDESVDYTPVKDKTFTVVVTDNNVVFTTTLPGAVWFTGNGQDYTAINSTVTANIPVAGTYKFVCSTSGSGKTLVSDTFNVVITKTDAKFFQSKFYTFLTGGYGKSKSWLPDAQAKVFAGPLSFCGGYDFAAKKELDGYWMWGNPDLSFCFKQSYSPMWDPTALGKDYGTMTFSLVNGITTYTADKKIDGWKVSSNDTIAIPGDPITEAGTYTIDTAINLLTIKNATIIHSYKPHAAIRDKSTKKITSIKDGRLGISDWNNTYIYEISDSTLRLAVSRDADVEGEGQCFLIYNFISSDYDKTHTKVATKSRKISLK